MGKFPDIERLGFHFSDEQRAIRETMARFADERLAPGAADRDRNGTFPTALVSELAGLGGMAMKTSAEDDGPGADNLAYALAVEAIARADASVAVIMVASNLSAAILAAHATEDQRDRFLRPVARGERGALSFGLTEPGAGSDAAAIRTTARLQGDSWIIDGTKQWITGAARADVFVIFAKTPEAGEGAVTCFIVEAGAPGFTVGRVEDKMGLRSSGTAQLHFDGVRVPASSVVGAVGQGYRVALGALAPSRVAIAAQSLGIAERAFELGLSYAQERRVFGQPVAAFQNSRFVLADMRCALDQAWLLMLRAARLLDSGIPIRGEASMAKLVASETCGRVVDQMLQLHGGNGYSREYEIERLYRDARVMRIYEGTSEIQREVIARDLLGN
ncbi:acyl-CoA dehydrogenase family protein [Ruegeria aquimaris]|uniref:Acyl-CoA dehydrogenase family protein n=1 Tax=Ruegeria aquimaris TaxID=2984333 RepID=A0ABT3AHT9_9RHOB|nr:acyl-CoA dehydrogenase family protein [Ruegeria sp. XHP0148]MCV2888240.1 acyl-CoA dehydrogenase family protein [Ruegeria sp. XHP0148]